ncbi:hypothetical protein [Crocinitomix catalasitica]|uniref:hypothetical protein n=1 Tax=Crocinitomix catalasitica TaxID=184607 RepID=UPI000480A2D9|nr:hypothetical protein [Crocinitomix catalasitica]
MKNVIMIVLLIAGQQVFGQNSKQTVAIANPYIESINITQSRAAKLIQLELIKLDKYNVYDEFDMAEIIKGNENYTNDCFGISCLSNMGKDLNVDYVIFASFTGLSNKIAISIKWIDSKSGKLSKSMVREFDNQETELQRMIEILLKTMNGIDIDQVLMDRLKFNNEVITSNNIGRINNSGPRVGYAMMVGDMQEYAMRPMDQGGLDIFPGMSMIGYQVEKQYVGTENFSALVEGIFNVSGLEQGQFIPSITILNGFRIGKAGWELAFGPGFGVKKVSDGFFDKDNRFGKGNNAYFSRADWDQYSANTYASDSSYYDQFGFYSPPSVGTATDGAINYGSFYDSRGTLKINTTFLFAFGRTFNAGALNIPVNVFYSSSRGGGLAGISVGFNVINAKKNINPNEY